MAAQILQDRHQPKLKPFLRRALPYEWVDEVAQQIWVAFYSYVCENEVREGVPQVLWGIARNKRADAVDRVDSERKIELSLPDTESGDANPAWGTADTIEEQPQKEAKKR